MTNGGDAAEMLVRLYLEGFEEVVKLSGKGIKELVPLLASTLKQESKSKGKARLTQMIKSGSPLKVFTFKNKDLKKFTEQAKRYGVLYTVLRDKNSKDPNATVDVIARAEDASKIQRIADRFEFSKVDKASIVKEVEKSKEKDKEEAQIERPVKSKGEIIREKIFLNYKKEIPYSCEVLVDEFKEGQELTRIRAIIYVSREQHKGIIIGHQGAALKKVGTEARKDIEQFVGTKVFLELLVKVQKDWRDKDQNLRFFGYEQD